jgi:hypothetical protein
VFVLNVRIWRQSPSVVLACGLGLNGHSLMARRPSTIAFSSPSSSSSPLQPSSKLSPQLSPLQGFRTPTSPWPPRGISRSVFPQHLTPPALEDPDELFTKFTVSEVKQVHNRLLYALSIFASTSFCVHSKPVCNRSDADAKQEELRLMVGCVDAFCPSRLSRTRI